MPLKKTRKYFRVIWISCYFIFMNVELIINSLLHYTAVFSLWDLVRLSHDWMHLKVDVMTSKRWRWCLLLREQELSDCSMKIIYESERVWQVLELNASLNKLQRVCYCAVINLTPATFYLAGKLKKRKNFLAAFIAVMLDNCSFTMAKKIELCV